MGYEQRLRVNRNKAKVEKNYYWGPVIYVAALALLMSIGTFLG